MKSVLQRLAVGVLAAWLVLLSAIAYPQLTAHAAQHDATTHATALCSRLCMAADAVEGTSAHLAPVDQVDFIERRKQGHSTFLINLDGGVCDGLTEWCRRELGAAGFESVHAGFQGGDVRFEGVDALVEPARIIHEASATSADTRL